MTMTMTMAKRHIPTRTNSHRVKFVCYDNGQRQNPTNDDEEEVLFLVWTVLELELNHFCHLVLTCNNNLVSWVKKAA